MAEGVTPYDIDLVHTNGTVVVHVAGEIDIDAAGSMFPAITPLLEGKPRQPLIVDMAAVTFLDSSGISCLLRIQRDAEAALTEMRIRNPSPAVNKVLDLAGLEFPTERTSLVGAGHSRT
jgi:anti-anti-sigma factor